jgi:hypothetical protein
MTEQKWTDGNAVSEGQYIQPKIYFKPEAVTYSTTDGEKTHIQLHKRWKGSGRFKSGVAIGSTDKGEPITMLIDIRVGQVPKMATQPSDTKIEL